MQYIIYTQHMYYIFNIYTIYYIYTVYTISIHIHIPHTYTIDR